MSHFLTLVLVDSAEPDPGSRATSMMMKYFARDPFDEDGQEIADWKCDGFVIGGRYDGMIWGKEQHYNLRPDEFQRRYGLDVVQPADNIRPVPQLVPDLLPFALVLPDGSWVDCEGLPDEEWRKAVQDLFAEHRERIAVAIDCHC
ncbi:hypothetical protein [Pseudonocardia sp. TRM90224]|uniref:hypothetical protein n=1 Tax=Pseudonocardia sp. TRM90224 TaxID=2812678 RepID=UPI001E3DBB02|nr:hypothetical protein [Pseudonocardia sp. TRM90224]